jgi:hypothetical protein
MEWKVSIPRLSQIPGDEKFMDHFQTIGSNLREKWNQVNRFTLQMGCQGAFFENFIEKLLTMPHMLQTLYYKLQTLLYKFATSCGKFKTLPGKFKRSCGKFKRSRGKFETLDAKFQTLGLKLQTYVL